MSETHLAQLEQQLLRVPGVRRARVVGGDVPSEIHIVTTSKRSPKQVVRDVQSLAAAGFGLPIDHRIVSVVQLDDAPPAPPADQVSSPPPQEAPPAASDADEKITGGGIRVEEKASGNGTSAAHRLVLDRVVLASKGDAGWVKVGLRWPNGATTEGAGVAGASRDARARGATNALLDALSPVLDAMDAKVDIDHLLIHRVGSNDSVLVRVVFYERGSTTPLVGSALVHDDVASAAVRATLQAINRKLRFA